MTDIFTKGIGTFTREQAASANTQQTLQKLQAMQNQRSEAEVREITQEFEAIFISQMLRNMYGGIEVDPVFGGGYAEEVFRDVLLDEYGRVMAKSGGVGISDMVQKELLQMQMQAGR